MNEKTIELLSQIYGSGQAASIAEDIKLIVQEYRERLSPPRNRGLVELPLDETDAFLITYGDSFLQEGAIPLQGLRDFADRKLTGVVSGIHILPFFPFSSDDGFSVIDYRKVNQELGEWKDVEELGHSFKLMSDLVLNHCSVGSPWFKAFLAGDPEYRDFFVTASPDDDLSMVVRPRTHPLLTPFETAEGTRYVWTTFSEDQVDLNFANQKVLLEMIRILLFHIEKGIQIIRLDAIAYLWKEAGHPSIHHPKTHAVVKLFRAVLDVAAPWVVVLTETNVPHSENISYFGNGNDEAHMVYQFPLPPLVLDAFLEEDSTVLRTWAESLTGISSRTTFFNFLASHDGIGVMPARGILPPERIERLVEATLERGGLISYKATSDGPVPYEMNITYLDAVAEKELPVSVRARKFLASQSIMLMLRGVPGIYVHSLTGSENWLEGVEETGRNRTINREKLQVEALLKEINSPGSLRNRIYSGFSEMLQARRTSPAFHPSARMEILPTVPAAFGLVRISTDKKERLLCLVNLAPTTTVTSFPSIALGGGSTTHFTELISGQPMTAVLSGKDFTFQLEPYGVYWLRPEV
jgi:sucrose phosphorylase